MRDILFRMQKSELEQLHDAIANQQVMHPFKTISIASILGNSEVVQAVTDSLNKIAAEFGADKVGAFVQCLYLDACKRKTEKNYELVWTGPEGAGAYNRDTRVVVQQLFDQTTKSVLIAGFAFYNGKEMFKCLADRYDADTEFKITLCINVHRKDRETRNSQSIAHESRENFFRYNWPGRRRPTLFFDPRSLESDNAKRAQLHAKCIVIDDEVAFVGSANFTDKAQLSNIEAGLLIRDAAFASDLANHFHSLIDANFLKAL